MPKYSNAEQIEQALFVFKAHTLDHNEHQVHETALLFYIIEAMWEANKLLHAEIEREKAALREAEKHIERFVTYKADKVAESIKEMLP